MLTIPVFQQQEVPGVVNRFKKKSVSPNLTLLVVLGQNVDQRSITI